MLAFLNIEGSLGSGGDSVVDSISGAMQIGDAGADDLINDLTINGNVSGDIKVEGDVRSTAALTVNGTMSGSLTVDANFGGSFEADSMTNNITLNGPLGIGGDITINDDYDHVISITDSSYGGVIVIDGDLTSNGRITLTGAGGMLSALRRKHAVTEGSIDLRR